MACFTYKKISFTDTWLEAEERVMESWMLILITSLFLSLLFSLLFPSYSSKKKLVPGPATVSFICNILLFRKLSSGIHPILRNLISRYGPIVALQMGSFKTVLISSHSIAHQALVKRAGAFSGRPNSLEICKLLKTTDQHDIGASSYGPTWRLLHGNMTMGILKPSSVNGYSGAREECLLLLIDRLRRESSSGSAVILKDHFQYVLYCLMVLMCLGKRLEEEKEVKEVVTAVRQLMLNVHRYCVIDLFPRLGKILLAGRVRELLGFYQNQKDVIIPLVKSRVEDLKKLRSGDVMAYVDTLINLELPVEKRNLNEVEMAGLCTEFLVAGTETTVVALEWIMANLVKYPLIQAKLYQEIKQVLGTDPDITVVIKEKDLQEMPYLKAVVLEGLRRHPPAQFGVPRTTTEDTELEGYFIPKNTTVAFMVAEMGLDPNVWENPMDFKPERFLSTSSNTTPNNGLSPHFDVTGSMGIKLMPFGAGRRICPGYGLALLHLEYFVANLVWSFQWTHPPNHPVDLSEKVRLLTSMKNPLKVHLSPRQ